MKVAAYQAPLLPAGSRDAAGLIRAQVTWCEAQGIGVLCCPEAVLGGLADHVERPAEIALDADALRRAVLPLASDTVTVVIGFTEIEGSGRLYNAAAVVQQGAVTGVYRKQHPAIRRSVYDAGDQTPVFRIDGLTFGIVICNDSNFPDLAAAMAAQGATALLVPTNNALPLARGGAELPAQATKVDVATATANRLWVVRADVAGRANGLISYGSSAIIDPQGRVVSAAQALRDDLIVADIPPRKADH